MSLEEQTRIALTGWTQACITTIDRRVKLSDVGGPDLVVWGHEHT